jgi:hypothetical protein
LSVSRRQVSHLAADIDTALFTAMGQTGQHDEHPNPERLLTPEAAAERITMLRQPRGRREEALT